MYRTFLVCLGVGATAIVSPALAQTIYPIDRATILSGSNFDFKVELPELAKREELSVLINGQPYDKVLGKSAEFIEREDGSDASTLLLRGVSLREPGSYKVQVTWKGQEKTVNWDVFGTPEKRQVKNIIFILGDGLSVGHRTGARIMSKGNTQGKANGKLAMDSLERAAFIGTSSTDSIAADSANTMSAYMTGQKSAVNAIGVYASRARNTLDHPRQETIAEIIRRNTKMSVGIVSNAELQDATPAAVVAHTRKRSDKAEIAGMLYDFQPDVLLGGGAAYFLPKTTPGSKRKDDIDYVTRFKDKGYTVVSTADELAATEKDGKIKKLVGLFHPGNMDGTLDQKVLKKGTVTKYPNQPDVPDMARAALDVLSRNPDGFFLMVEAALIDKYSHPLDWDRALYDTITLDKVVALAQDFAKTHPDTLIILTGDHTHGISVIGTVDDDKPGPEMREKVGTYANAGFPNYKIDANGYPERIDVSRRLAVFSSNFPDYYETFRPKLDNPFTPSLQNEKNEYVANEAYKNVPGAVLRIGNISRKEDTGVHAVDDVVLQAQGPGSEKFRGYMENTDVFRIIAEGLALGAATHPVKTGSVEPSASQSANAAK